MGEVKRFTRAEVKLRDGRGDTPLWMIVRDSVYDVTTYTQEHPGGVETITDVAGLDASRDFDDAGHTKDAWTILAKYKIGELIEEEKHYDANGKKKKKKKQVVDDKPKESGARSCLNIVSCGLLG